MLALALVLVSVSISVVGISVSVSRVLSRGFEGWTLPPQTAQLPPPKKVVIIQVSVHEVSIPRQSKTLYDKEHEVVP